MGETIFKNVFFSLVYEQEMSYTHATLLGVSENQGHRNVKHFGGDMLIRMSTTQPKLFGIQI